MTFLLEAVIVCILFHILIVSSLIKDPIKWVEDYPPAIVRRCEELGLIKKVEAVRSKEFFISKTKKAILLSVILTLIVIFVNGCETFGQAFLTGYGLWAIVAWYDAIILDCIWFCHSKKCIIPGTEDMTEAYHDYMFHIKMSCVGMVLGLPVCILTGAFTYLIYLVI